ncbi:MAG: SRPBCC family protein [Anaerolineae bacterium]|nr:SRPBCC family protein [Anaerolineae bacterium]
MTQPSSEDRRTQASQFIKAPREKVYQAFINPDAVASWLAPDKMKGHVEIFEPHAGGRFRMSLTYLDQKDRPRGKTSDDTDTSEGKFVELIPNEKIVQVFEFESDQPDMAGQMKITWSLVDAARGTEATVRFDDIPKGISLEDNELGSQQSLRKLAAYVERGTTPQN